MRAQAMLSNGATAVDRDAVEAAMRATFERDGVPFPVRAADGSLAIS